MSGEVGSAKMDGAELEGRVVCAELPTAIGRVGTGRGDALQSVDIMSFLTSVCIFLGP